MTYLDLCNQVLLRMREDPMATVVGIHDDEVHDLVCAYVNDAKNLVEDSWDWTNLSSVMPAVINGTPAAPLPTFTLTGVGELCKIKEIYVDGSMVKEMTRSEYAQKLSSVDPASPMPTGSPEYFVPMQDRPSAIPGAASDKVFFVWPHVDRTVNAVTHVQLKTPDMNADTTYCPVPYQPVMAYALALLSRERGEVNGQTSTDLFGVAKTVLSDAIAIDANNHAPETIWSVV